MTSAPDVGKQALVDRSTKEDKLDESFGFIKLNDLQGVGEKVGWLLNAQPVSSIISTYCFSLLCI